MLDLHQAPCQKWRQEKLLALHQNPCQKGRQKKLPALHQAPRQKGRQEKFLRDKKEGFHKKKYVQQIYSSQKNIQTEKNCSRRTKPWCSRK